MSDGLYRANTSTCAPNSINNAVGENINNSTAYIKDDDICIEEEGAQHQQHQQINSGNCNDDAAALLVVLYLLFISSLLVGTIVMGVFVVVQYGLVVLVAVCTAVGGLVVVGATVYSVITHDAKLNKARSKIKRWHVKVKDEILKEIDNLKDDLAAYTSGTLMLTYYDGGVDNTEDEICNDNGDENYANDATTDEFDNKQKQEARSATQKKAHKPKSMLFRAFATFAKPSKKEGTDSSQKKKKKSLPFIRSPKRDGIGGRGQHKKSMRLFGKKNNRKENAQAEASNYVPPNVV